MRRRNNPGGPSVKIRVLTRGRLEDKNQTGGCKDRSRGQRERQTDRQTGEKAFGSL